MEGEGEKDMLSWILIMALTCVNLNVFTWANRLKERQKSWLYAQGARYLFGLVLSFLFIYVWLIDVSVTGLLNTFGFVVAINLIVSGLFHVVPKPSKKSGSKVKKLKKPSFSVGKESGIGVLLLLGLLAMNYVYPLTVTKELAQLGEFEVSEEQIESVTEDGVRSVPYTYARSSGSIVVFASANNASTSSWLKNIWLLPGIPSVDNKLPRK